jgi:intracellular septation protein
MNILFEFFPLLLFLGALLLKDIYAAVVVLMISMPIGLLVKTVRSGSLDKMYMWSTVFALFFGGLTLYFRNPYFTYWKPTAFYWVVGIAFFVSTWVSDKPLAQRFFGLVEGLNLDLSGSLFLWLPESSTSTLPTTTRRRLGVRSRYSG